MSSSNRHWPSLFKSKPTPNSTPNQCHHDHLPRNPYTQGAGAGADEERSPEPKPRWNPRPEQIRILEGIFNSGTVNPPRDEIRRIRAQLQEFGHVGDANVFYWFQNRKSRSKHKHRHLLSTKLRPSPLASSSSSSDKSNDKPLSLSSSTLIDLLNSPTASVNQPFLAEPSLLFSGQETSHGICFPATVADVNLLGDVMAMNHGSSRRAQDHHHHKADLQLQQQQISYAAPPVDLTVPSPPNQIPQGVPFNVREAFGDDVVLIESLGQPVPTDEWGVTRQPLQHGGFYYLLRSPAPPPPPPPPQDDRTIHLI